MRGSHNVLSDFGITHSSFTNSDNWKSYEPTDCSLGNDYN